MSASAKTNEVPALAESPTTVEPQALAVSTAAGSLESLSTAPGPHVLAEAPLKSSRQVMKGVARASWKMLVGVVPSLVGSGLWGAVKGFFLFGTLGLALAGAFLLVPRLLDLPPTPGWLEALALGLTPFALALGGGYALMLHGIGSRLAEEARERGWMGNAYAVLKPAALHVARRLGSTGPLGRQELIQAIESSVAARLREPPEEDTGPPSRTEQLERFLMEQSRRVLTAVALRTVLTAPDTETAVRELETLAVDRLEVSLVERLEDLFFVQQVLALVVGLLVAAIPAFILLFSR